MRYLVVLALLAVGCVTGEDHPELGIDQRGDLPSDMVSADAGVAASYDAGPPCPVNTLAVAVCNSDPQWTMCRTTIYPNPPACANLDKTSQAWRDCVQPPVSGCTLQIGPGLVGACVPSCQ